MYFDPKTNKFPYTEFTDQHYLKVKKNNGLVFDENYPYIDNSKKFKFKKWWFDIPYYLIAIPFALLRLGLKVKGRKNLKKYKDVIDKGVISICNHVHMFDYLAITHAIRFRKPKVLVWASNVRGESGSAVRMVGGIPIPEDDFRATAKYLKDVKEYLDKGGWLHIYPEGSMWEYYAPIRPFKKGAAHLAIKYDKPIIPMAISYRKPGWIRKKVFKQIATLTLSIGEPIFVNKDLPKEEQEKDLNKRCHDAVCLLAGIDPNDNIYDAEFKNSKRIDYYTDTYGVGYKGSW